MIMIMVTVKVNNYSRTFQKSMFIRIYQLFYIRLLFIHLNFSDLVRYLIRAQNISLLKISKINRK